MGIPSGISARFYEKYTYDFSLLGGAVETIPLIGSDLPQNAIVYGGAYDLITAFTSGASAYCSLELNIHNDLVSSLIYSNAAWNTTGMHAIIPVMTAATAIKITTVSNRRPCLRITGGDADIITAGKFNLFLVYLISD